MPQLSTRTQPLAATVEYVNTRWTHGWHNGVLVLCKTPLSGESSIMPMLQLPEDQGIISPSIIFSCVPIVPHFHDLERLLTRDASHTLDLSWRMWFRNFTGYWMLSPGLYWIHILRTGQSTETVHKVSQGNCMIHYNTVHDADWYRMSLHVVSVRSPSEGNSCLPAQVRNHPPARRVGTAAPAHPPFTRVAAGSPGPTGCHRVPQGVTGCDRPSKVWNYHLSSHSSPNRSHPWRISTIFTLETFIDKYLWKALVDSVKPLETARNVLMDDVKPWPPDIHTVKEGSE